MDTVIYARPLEPI